MSAAADGREPRGSLDGFKRDSVPEGWVRVRGAMTAPLGWAWVSNGRSRFDPEGGYEHALVPERIARGLR